MRIFFRRSRLLVRRWTPGGFRMNIATGPHLGSRTVPRYFAYLFALLATIVVASGASAADVKVMISAGFFSVYKELGPAFEKSSGHRLVPTRGPSVGDSPEAIPARLGRGEEADVVIMDGVGVDLLEQRQLARAG